ncbi:MAG: hypothetical protein AAB438_00265 [Patescibacteria group bacterium]
MKNLFAFGFLFFLPLLGQSQTQKVVLPPMYRTDSIKIAKAIIFLSDILLPLYKEKKDSAMLDSLKLWTKTFSVGTGLLVKSEGGMNVMHVHDNSTKIIVLPDSCVNSVKQEAAFFAMPRIFPDKRYIYAKYSAVKERSVERIAVSAGHELVHIYQFRLNPQDFFLQGEQLKIAKRKREVQAWQFEARLFMGLHPEYEKYIGNIDCQKPLMQIFNLTNTIPDYIIDYIVVLSCPDFFIERQGY